MCTRHFEEIEHAELYAQCRPDYSPEFFKAVIDYCSSGGGRFELAVDVGCGTGHQSTIKLVPHFKKVIGVDVSEAQLKQAPKDVPNLEFKHGTAEDMSFLEPGNVDLLLAVCSLHWFDIDKFFVETKRVLRAGGSLAVAVFSTLRITLPESEGDHLLQQFFNTYLSEYINDRHRLARSEYESVELPFVPVERKIVHFTKKWTVGQLTGFLSSHSGWRARLKVFPTCESLEKLKEEYVKYNLFPSDHQKCLKRIKM